VVTFAEFIAASPDPAPLDRKELLFVYRAIEDLAAELRVSARELRVLELSHDAKMPLARLGARVTDIASARSDDRFDVVVATELFEQAQDPARVLQNLTSHLETHGLVLVAAPNRFGARDCSPARLEKLFAASGLRVYRFMNAGFVLSRSKLVRRNRALGTFDAEFANLVPHWMASGWYIALRRSQ
jgi:hypothetical protein